MIERKCVQCGKKFVIEDSEAEFFNKKNLSLPKRCKECRNKNRNVEKKKENKINKGNKTECRENKNNKAAQHNNKDIKNESSKTAQNNNKYIENNKTASYNGQYIENNKKVQYNNEYIKNKSDKEFENITEHIKKENNENRNIWKTLIASFAVIIGLAGGWLGCNIINDADSNISPIQDETDVESNVLSAQRQNESDKNTPAVQGENKSNSNDSSEQESIDSGKGKETTVSYKFKSSKDLKDHFKKHGGEFGYENKEQYLEGANKVINSPDALHKKEKEDNDDVYYIESTNEFVIVSTYGYIRTYFKPTDGIEYYNRQ